MSVATKRRPARRARTSNKPTPERIVQLPWAFAPTLMAEAAIRNRVFDVLDKGSKTLDQVVKATGASARGLRALLNGLVAIGLLNKRGDKFTLAPDSAAFLVSGKPSFMGGVLLHASEHLIPKWLGLTEIVRLGKPTASVNQATEGSKFFVDFVEDIFNMSYGAAKVAADAVLAKKRGPISVLDIAAGSGVWGIAMAQKSRQVKVTAVDWPDVTVVTRRVAKKQGVADQFSFVGGDILEVGLGRDHNVATLGHILHSEGEARSRKLLKRIAAAMTKGGTIVIGEFVPDEDRSGPANALIFALNMLVNTDHGDAFTLEEIKSWLEAAGFHKVRRLKAPAPSPLILADKK